MYSCHTKPCLNNGKCVKSNQDEYVCHCPKGFVGDLCELIELADSQSSCATNPCKNQGSCVPLDNDQYFCLCKSRNSKI